MICPNCGNQMSWESDFTFEDLCAEGDGTITFYECMNCGTSAEIRIPAINPYGEENRKGRKDGEQGVSPSDVV